MSTPKLIHVNQIDKDSIEYAFDINKRTEKVITFVFPSIKEGAVGSFYKFPFDGVIKKIDAYCTNESVVDTIFRIEKCSEADYRTYLNMAQKDAEDLEIQEADGTVTRDFMNIDVSVTPWKNINGELVKIPSDQTFQDDTYTIVDDKVHENDLFRVWFVSFTPEEEKLMTRMAYNLTVQIVIQTDDNY